MESQSQFPETESTFPENGFAFSEIDDESWKMSGNVSSGIRGAEDNLALYVAGRAGRAGRRSERHRIAGRSPWHVYF
jgi:hypothetical protein